MKKFVLALAVLSSALLGLGSCGGGEPLPPATGLLYVLEKLNKIVYVYDNIATLDGAPDPVRSISGDNTLIDNPTAIAIDTRRDILYVAESTGTQLLAFIPASQTDGDVAPLRVFPNLTKGVSLYYDLDNDRLYAADSIDRSIKAWDKIGSMKTGTTFSRRVGLNYTPSSVFVDAQRNLMYVGDPGTATINVYSGASTLGVNNPAPTTTIQDSTQVFVDINSITMNVPNNFLYVAEAFNPSIEIFNQASTLNGAVPTDRSLEGDVTGISLDLNQIYFLENVLYVQLGRTQIGIFNDANTVTGNTAPNRTVTINNAQEVLGLAVDLAH